MLRDAEATTVARAAYETRGELFELLGDGVGDMLGRAIVDNYKFVISEGLSADTGDGAVQRGLSIEDWDDNREGGCATHSHTRFTGRVRRRMSPSAEPAPALVGMKIASPSPAYTTGRLREASPYI